MGLEDQIEFSAQIVDEGKVAVHGDVDLASAPLLEAVLREAATIARHNLVVDLSDVAFMDSAGMNVLVRVFKLVDPDGGSITLAAAQPSVRRALEIGGVAAFATLS